MPVIQYFITRRYPRSWARYIITPAMFGAAGQIPPATLYFLWQWVIIGLIFNALIRRRFFGWWSMFSVPALLQYPLTVYPSSLQLCHLRCSRHWDGGLHSHFRPWSRPQRNELSRLVGHVGVAEYIGLQRHGCDKGVHPQRHGAPWAKHLVKQRTSEAVTVFMQRQFTSDSSIEVYSCTCDKPK